MEWSCRTEFAIEVNDHINYDLIFDSSLKRSANRFVISEQISIQGGLNLINRFRATIWNHRMFFWLSHSHSFWISLRDYKFSEWNQIAKNWSESTTLWSYENTPLIFLSLLFIWIDIARILITHIILANFNLHIVSTIFWEPTSQHFLNFDFIAQWKDAL